MRSSLIHFLSCQGSHVLVIFPSEKTNPPNPGDWDVKRAGDVRGVPALQVDQENTQ